MSWITEKHLEEKAERKSSRKSLPPAGIIILLAAVMAALLFGNISGGKEQGGEEPSPAGQQIEQTGETDPVEKLTNSISLPGYGGLNLIAGKTEQTLALTNPAENFCQIRISLILEDGTVIWESELTPPGEQAQVVLNEALEKGDYNATLKYDCFQMDENKTPLNGAACQLVLHAN
ncbi:MAG: hypothetical protein IIV90_07985 [Oscillospiraceae bacterium]|nr:hypothetical protein [Oscillospiraceae bacterium]